MSMLKVRSVKLLGSMFSIGATLVACASDGTLTQGEDDEATLAPQWVDEQEPADPDSSSRGNRCTDPLQPGQERNCRLGSRNYTVRAGTTMNTSGPVPVVIDIPSVLGTPAQMIGRERFCIAGLCWTGIGSGWAAESDTPGGGFVVVVPERSASGSIDASFLRQLVTELRRSVDVDLNKVYLSGMSDGANIALEEGCAGASSFAGTSPNSGAGSCGRVARPLPVIAFASRSDLNYLMSNNAVQSAARANGCRGNPKPWRTFDGDTRDTVCRSANGDARAKLVPCSDVRQRIQPTECRYWDDCQGGVEVVMCDVAAANPHGILNVSGDAHLLYENATFLNTPSVAWRFFKQF